MGYPLRVMIIIRKNEAPRGGDLSRGRSAKGEGEEVGEENAFTKTMCAAGTF